MLALEVWIKIPFLNRKWRKGAAQWDATYYFALIVLSSPEKKCHIVLELMLELDIAQMLWLKKCRNLPIVTQFDKVLIVILSF